jgi:hypothetical protein
MRIGVEERRFQRRVDLCRRMNAALKGPLFHKMHNIQLQAEADKGALAE